MAVQKRTVYILLAAVTGLLLAVVLWMAGSRSEGPLGGVQFVDGVQGKTLVPHYDEAEDTYYLFLPAYASPADVQLSAPLYGEGRVFRESLSGIPLDTSLSLSLSPASPGFTLQVRQGGNLPTLFIDTSPGAMAHVNADKENKADAVAVMVDASGETLFSRTATLTGRGNGTWNGEQGRGQAKRPYNLNLDKSVDVGPFTDLSAMCLFAEYSDESKLRNALAYYTGQALDIAYASPYMYTDVYINGSYAGLYGITTKQEYRKYIQQDDIQAVFELCGIIRTPDFRSDTFGRPIRLYYGNQEAAKRAVDALDAALANQDWQLCESLIDLDTLALRYSMEEFFGNLDMSYASQYYYLDRDNVIHCMLPWDYDWSLMSQIRYFNNRQEYAIMAYRDPYEYSWYPPLLEYDGFTGRVTRILDEQYTDAFLDELDGYLASCAQQITPSWENDALRYRHSVPYNDSPYQSGLASPEEFKDLFSAYFRSRRAFLQDYFTYKDSYCVVTFTGPLYGNLCVPKGANLQSYLEGASILDSPARDPSIQNFRGWSTEDGLKPQDIQAVTEDLTFFGIYDMEEEAEPIWDEEAAAVHMDTLAAKLKRHIIPLGTFGVLFLLALLLILREVRSILWKRRSCAYARKASPLPK